MVSEELSNNTPTMDEKTQRLMDTFAMYQKAQLNQKVVKSLSSGRFRFVKRLNLMKGRYHFPGMRKKYNSSGRAGVNSYQLIKNSAINSFSDPESMTQQDLHQRIYQIKMRQQMAKIQTFVSGLQSTIQQSYMNALLENGVVNENDLGSSSSTPLTMCMQARVHGTEPLTVSGSCEYGSYNGETGPGTFTATLNEYFYSSGVKCGDCFEISGPNGITQVRAVNFCAKETCPGDSPYFMLTPDAFAQISSKPLSVIYDAGFRKVACSNVTGPLKSQTSNDSSRFYVKILLFNSVVGIQKVTIKGTGMNDSVAMSRENSAQFVWNEKGVEMKFPAVITATSQYGDSVSFTMDSLNKSKIYSFDGNFKTPVNVVPNAPERCTLAQTKTTIYSDSLTEGWDSWSSKSFNQLNTTDFSIAKSGKASLSIELVGKNSHLTLHHDGEFQTDYFKGITFSIRANRQWKGLKVYFHPDSWWVPSNDTVITTEWCSFTVPFSALFHNALESFINFGNSEVENN
eukprot:gene3096-3872_t